jgi:hypothetical protein
MRKCLKCIPENTRGADPSGNHKARQVDGLKSGLADFKDSNSIWGRVYICPFALRCTVHV